MCPFDVLVRTWNCDLTKCSSNPREILLFSAKMLTPSRSRAWGNQIIVWHLLVRQWIGCHLLIRIQNRATIVKLQMSPNAGWQPYCQIQHRKAIFCKWKYSRNICGLSCHFISYKLRLQKTKSRLHLIIRFLGRRLQFGSSPSPHSVRRRLFSIPPSCEWLTLSRAHCGNGEHSWYRSNGMRAKRTYRTIDLHKGYATKEENKTHFAYNNRTKQT